MDSPQAHRKVVQSENPELEPITLPQVHHHQPLSHTSTAPASRYNQLKDDDSDLATLSEEPGQLMHDLSHEIDSISWCSFYWGQCGGG